MKSNSFQMHQKSLCSVVQSPRQHLCLRCGIFAIAPLKNFKRPRLLQGIINRSWSLDELPLRNMNGSEWN